MNGYSASSEMLVEVRGLRKHFDLRKGLARLVSGQEGHVVKAVHDVDISVRRGETVGLIGESGCGKTTLGRTILRLQEPTAGSIFFDGQDITRLNDAALKPLRRRMQIIFQDPYASLNPRRTVEEIVGLPLRLHENRSSEATRERVKVLLERVGLRASHIGRYPHQFSGGQRQRIGIARALIVNPEFVVCDEPVSALDVSIQAQIIELLDNLKRELELTYLFISHDLSVIGYVADRIVVMYLGEIVETGTRDQVLDNPCHPYTQSLLSAVPQLDPQSRQARIQLKGDLPSPMRPPSGCKFHSRCPKAMKICSHVKPRIYSVSAGHQAACHLYEESTR
ncbi:MAG: dipeptide ABC transporter ATP-binding protein [Albidovulum sp.]|nr:dipeptide ABC transporter ATP-binding protein [Albidovulum sp.]